MVVQICIGSSCHIKGSHEIVDLMKKAVEDNHLENTVALAGSFCTGKCNRDGVTITVDDMVHTGVTVHNFDEFFKTNILDKVKAEG